MKNLIISKYLVVYSTIMLSIIELNANNMTNTNQVMVQIQQNKIQVSTEQEKKITNELKSILEELILKVQKLQKKQGNNVDETELNKIYNKFAKKINDFLNNKKYIQYVSNTNYLNNIWNNLILINHQSIVNLSPLITCNILLMNKQVDHYPIDSIDKIKLYFNAQQEFSKYINLINNKSKNGESINFSEIAQEIYKYCNKLKQQKLINNSKDLNYIWKQLFNNNKKLKNFYNPIDSLYQEFIDNNTRIKYIKWYINGMLTAISNDKNISELKYTRFINNYINLIQEIKTMKTNISALTKTDQTNEITNITKVFLNNITNIMKVIEQLQTSSPTEDFSRNLNLYNSKDKCYQTFKLEIPKYQLPILICYIQEQISKLFSNGKTTIFDLDDNYTTLANFIDVIDNTPIEHFESELDYIIYFIKNGPYNNSVVQAINQYVNKCINNIDKGDIILIQLGKILSEMEKQPKIQQQYNAIINLLKSKQIQVNDIIAKYTTKKNTLKTTINTNKKSMIKEIEESIQTIISPNTNIYKIPTAYTNFTITLYKLDNLTKDFTYDDRMELLNDLYEEIWKIYNVNSVINVTKKLQSYELQLQFERLEKYATVDAIKNLSNILNSESFKKEKPFYKIKQIISWYKYLLELSKNYSNYY